MNALVPLVLHGIQNSNTLLDDFRKIKTWTLNFSFIAEFH